VRVWGADIVRDSERGVPQSLFGTFANDIDVTVTPGFDRDAARTRLTTLGTAPSLLREPELVVLPLPTGSYRLAYTAAVGSGPQAFRVFIDATTGAELQRYSTIETQAAVGTGRGVLGDEKKMSVLAQAGAFFADDQLRPPTLQTFDLHANLGRTIDAMFGTPLAAADRAADTDNQWTDAGVVDAHTHIGWTYDYYFKRFGRRGLDDLNRPLTAVVNAVTPDMALMLSADYADFVNNAFWCGECGASGLMYFGSGIPAGYYYPTTGQSVLPLAGSLDIAAHELSHGVIDSSSQLLYWGEPAALNEAFADMMGTSVEFFYQKQGVGPGLADYKMGEDSFRGARPGVADGIRSLANPQAFGYPDHYSRRFTGDADNGGAHFNAGIPGNAFYLAIEGGANRTSGLTVQGVGAANREQIEKVFYRAFVYLLPWDADFSTARAATIQAARDLYGTGTSAERAVTQAWTAVGVL
jgi:thermolysin